MGTSSSSTSSKGDNNTNCRRQQHQLPAVTINEEVATEPAAASTTDSLIAENTTNERKPVNVTDEVEDATATSSATNELPDGWERFTMPDTGQVCYYCAEANTTQWDALTSTSTITDTAEPKDDPVIRYHQHSQHNRECSSSSNPAARLLQQPTLQLLHQPLCPPHDKLVIILSCNQFGVTPLGKPVDNISRHRPYGTPCTVVVIIC